MLTGYAAWRSLRGSWYIQTLVKVIMKHAKTKSLSSMLEKVSYYYSFDSRVDSVKYSVLRFHAFFYLFTFCLLFVTSLFYSF